MRLPPLLQAPRIDFRERVDLFKVRNSAIRGGDDLVVMEDCPHLSNDKALDHVYIPRSMACQP